MFTLNDETENSFDSVTNTQTALNCLKNHIHHDFWAFFFFNVYCSFTVNKVGCELNDSFELKKIIQISGVTTMNVSFDLWVLKAFSTVRVEKIFQLAMNIEYNTLYYKINCNATIEWDQNNVLLKIFRQIA